MKLRLTALPEQQQHTFTRCISYDDSDRHSLVAHGREVGLYEFLCNVQCHRSGATIKRPAAPQSSEDSMGATKLQAEL